MREELAKIDNIRAKFTGEFEKFGEKNNFWGSNKTILLKYIKNLDGKIVTDHLWFMYTKNFQKLGELNTGDIIEFEARVSPYEKGYISHRQFIDERELDYKLNYPTKIKKI